VVAVLTVLRVTAAVSVLCLAGAQLCLAQGAGGAPAGQPAVDQQQLQKQQEELAAKVGELRAMGVPEDAAGLLALLDVVGGDEDGGGNMLPLLMLMAQKGGGNGGDIMGVFLLMNMMDKGASASAPTAVKADDNTLLVIDRGKVFKVDLAEMKVVGEVAYRTKPRTSIIQLVMPLIAGARGKAAEAGCASNLRQLAMGVLMYAQDFDGALPGEGWVADIQPYIKNDALFRCPNRPEAKVGYAFNRALLGLNQAKIQRPAETIMLFEAKAQGDAPVGGAEDVPVEGIHDGGIYCAFADGHVKRLSVNDARQQLKQP
jgi:prepilin-type processing-associated H-X9-DG protein